MSAESRLTLKAILLVSCALGLSSQIALAYAKSSKASEAPRTLTREVAERILDRVFPTDIAGIFHTYVLVRSLPGLRGPESQIIIGMKHGEQAQVYYRKASISLAEAFGSGEHNEEEVAQRMAVRQRNLIVPASLANELIAGCWMCLQNAITQMREKPPYEVMLDADHLIVEVFAVDNKVRIDIAASSGGDNKLDIRAVTEWVSFIRRWVEAIPSDETKGDKRQGEAPEGDRTLWSAPPMRHPDQD